MLGTSAPGGQVRGCRGAGRPRLDIRNAISDLRDTELFNVMSTDGAGTEPTSVSIGRRRITE